jgi:5-methylcytosine-specific restriction endonuclease McrA
MPRENRPRGDTLTRLYRSSAWQCCRQEVLERDDYRCQACGQPADSVHHSPIGARELIDSGQDPADPSTCVSLCKSCHGRADSARTAASVKAHKPKPNRFMRTVLGLRK